ncbi:MAG: cysteine peptidase family C39 domain-containing protein [Vicinamibacterales bacterium]|nr:cysteine peptidase family C39 domain-containing protein [Vicinamibacterales bacterium]
MRTVSGEEVGPWRPTARGVAGASGAAALVCALLATAYRVEHPALVQALDSRGVVHQRTVDDCGVAALIMLLERMGHGVDTEQFFTKLSVPPGGLSLTEMSIGAASEGLALRPVSVAPARHETLPPPWIAHLSWNHYVVVEAHHGDRLIVADPRAGRLSYDAAIFARVWSGFALLPVVDAPSSVDRQQ